VLDIIEGETREFLGPGPSSTARFVSSLDVKVQFDEPSDDSDEDSGCRASGVKQFSPFVEFFMASGGERRCWE
jgi:hypothetical protein